MRTLTLILLLFLCACDETHRPTRCYLEQGANTLVYRVQDTSGMAIQYVSLSPLSAVIVEITYYGGVQEIWALPRGGVMWHHQADSTAIAYPALISHEWALEGPVLIKENGDGLFQTTTGAECAPHRVLMWQGAQPARWRIWK